MVLAVSPENIYCSTKKPSKRAIQTHIILNLGGLGVIFLIGIFFFPLAWFENFSFILVLNFLKLMLNSSYLRQLSALIVLQVGITPQILYSVMLASFSFENMHHYIHIVEQNPFAQLKAFLVPGILF